MDQDLQNYCNTCVDRATAGAISLADATSDQKNTALRTLAELLITNSDALIAANQLDVQAATGLSDAMMDRLRLNEARIAEMAAAVGEVADLPDPVGTYGPTITRPNGLQVRKMKIPLGVIMMIFESRPNVAIDCGALCIKSSNAAILRGGRETINTIKAYQPLFEQALSAAGLSANCVTLIDNADRSIVSELLTRNDAIDLVIPRGGEALIRAVSEQSRIPVIQHYKGVCHVYVDASANPQRAIDIVVNAKTQRPGVCNAAETLLIDADYAHSGDLLDALHDAGVEIRGCERTTAIRDYVLAATDADWDTEYLDLIIAVKVVDGLDAAISHIRTHTSDHTEAIVAQDWDACRRFERRIQSSTVVINASTRFADGGQLGLGTEIGISTSKLHAYGPMGLQELTTEKFVVHGQGQIRT